MAGEGVMLRWRCKVWDNQSLPDVAGKDEVFGYVSPFVLSKAPIPPTD
ncbi:hypothetical protein FHS81_000788 [Pseudochelatococcus contaminans]|uniref:Uncharacterized protein n=1 Tax=Pseudochelatococcus contaminans TaxID=1538103 RepID=A0A7W5Z2R3_9HYPH|nr:hypothetical protein [Pseudochelatococcus contaminans]